MKSKTKNNISNETIKKLFEVANISDVTDIRPLGAGEFNAVFAVTAGAKQYALKVAPPPEAPVLPYEKGMMASEVYWYKRMREETPINVPEVYFYDDSKTIISSEYFIMDKICGEQADKIKLSDEEKRELLADIAKMAAEMHKIKNDKFGYIQQALYDDWYQAVRSMTESLLNSSQAKGYNSKRGNKLLSYIDKYKDILKKADCRMVNYDIWLPNIIAKRIDNNIKYWWIDPERCFWGDRVADFLCLDMMKFDLKKKTESIEAYNKVASEPVIINRETEIRYGIMMAYMGLLMETEKYYRYTPAHFGWWRNVIASAFIFYKIGFKILKGDR